MYRIKKEIKKSEEGSSLVIALMVLLVLSALGSALGIMTVGSYKLADINHDYTSAYYVAEAGANMAYEEIKKEIISIYEDDENYSSFFDVIDSFPIIEDGKTFSEEKGEYIFDPQSGSYPKASVTVVLRDSNLEDKKEYIIQSTGEVNGSTRTVQKPIFISKPSANVPEYEHLIPPTGSALTFNKELILGNEITIDENIRYGSNSKIEKRGSDNNKDYQELKDSSLDWDKYYQVFNEVFPQAKNSDNYTGKLLEDKNSLTLTGDTKLENLTIEQKENYTILSDKDIVNLWVNNLHIGHQAELEINSSNTINIFVSEKLSFGNNHVNINSKGNASNLNIFYKGNEDVKFPGKLNFKGSLFIKEANLYFEGDTNIVGMIITGGDSTKFSNDTVINYDNGFSDRIPFNTTGKNSAENELILTQPAIEQ